MKCFKNLSVLFLLVYVGMQNIFPVDNIESNISTTTVIENDTNIEKRIKEEYKTARSYSDKKKYNKAIMAYNDILQKNAEYLSMPSKANRNIIATINNSIGLCYTRQGIYSKAKVYFEEAIKIKSEDNYYSAADINLSQTYISMGLYNQAIEAAKKIIKVRENSTVAHELIAVSYYNQGLLDISREEREKSLISSGDSSNYASAHNGLGNIYTDIGLYESAGSEYQKALEIVPDFAPAIYGLGRLYNIKGELEKASEYFERENSKKNIEYNYIMLVATYKELNNRIKFDKALKEGVNWYKHEIKNKIEEGNNYAGLSLLYLYFSPVPVEAKKLAEKAIELKPFFWSYYALGQYYKKIKNYEDAIKYFKISIEKNPAFFGTSFSLSECYRALSMFAEAEETCKKALSINPKNRFIKSELEKVNKKSNEVAD
ncbi:MAG: tetratricopeptide repeat protein [Elusimicrobiota bacterium]|nr:tetratricopeptide repeat protein [Elusimicrobiota bacterium]